MIYLIVGRSGAGKDTLQSILQEGGLKNVLSYATRPKRTPDENSHIFISSEEAKNFPDRVAFTTINGYDYFATREQVENSDIYIIDPNGLYQLISNMPEEAFMIINVRADDKIRMERAMSRGDREEEKIRFQHRSADEYAQFCEFEDKMDRFLSGGENAGDIFPANVVGAMVLQNNEMTDLELRATGASLIEKATQHKRLYKIVNNIRDNVPEEICPLILKDGYIQVQYNTPDGEACSERISADLFTAILLDPSAPGIIGSLFQNILAFPDNILKKVLELTERNE